MYTKKYNAPFPISPRDFSLVTLEDDSVNNFLFIAAKSIENPDLPEFKGSVRA